VIVYALLFGRFHCNHDGNDSHDVRVAIAKGSKISFESEVQISTSCLEFSRALLQQDPDNRPSSFEALEMTYMVDTIAEDHLPTKRLPDLGPMLSKVRKFRSFEYHEPQEKSVIDDVLNRHQLTKHGIPLPNLKDTSIVMGGVCGAEALASLKHLDKRNSAILEKVATGSWHTRISECRKKRRSKSWLTSILPSDREDGTTLYWI
jgi:hypothetical protein